MGQYAGLHDVTSESGRHRFPPKHLSDQALAWIVRLHSGEAPDTDWAAFRSWRRQSADHEAAALEAEMLWSDASELHRDPATGLVRPGRGRGGASRRAVIGGIAVLAGAGAAGMWMNTTGRLWRADHATGVAQTRIIDLDDGSRVTLNAMSAIDIDYGPRLRRIVLVGGEAFFEVHSNRARPFVVDIGASRVEALGTAFNVNANLPGDSVAVAVTQHSVRVDARMAQAPASASGDGIVVSEGEQVVISPDGRLGSIVRQETSAATAWRSGMYVAEDKRLDEVIAAFNAYHDGWIVLRGGAVQGLRVNAVLDLRTPDASLDALASGLPIRVRHVSRYLTVITGA